MNYDNPQVESSEAEALAQIYSYQSTTSGAERYAVAGDSTPPSSDSDTESLGSSCDEPETPDVIVASQRCYLPQALTTRLDYSHWNDYYQSIYQKLCDPTTPASTKIGQLSDLFALGQSFRRVVELRVHQKANVGGIAGGTLLLLAAAHASGTKFAADGLFFKFNLDHEDLYKGTSNAAKAAFLELRNTNYLANQMSCDFRFPMMLVCSHYGFSITAMALLPLNPPKSLVYGSQNAGVTFNYSEDVAPKVDALCQHLNLAHHQILDYSIPLPVDGEVHLGKDGNLYMLDLARLMPSEPPFSRHTTLYRCFRHEFVFRHRHPLCSDAFSSFLKNDPNAKAHNGLVADALATMQSRLIPKFVESLLQFNPVCGVMVLVYVPQNGSLLPELKYVRASNISEIERYRVSCHPFEYDLKGAMHFHGINMRFLGLVYDRLLKKPATPAIEYWKEEAEREMVIRVAKTTIFELMQRAIQKFKSLNTHVATHIVTDYLNLLFGQTERANAYWENELTLSIRTSYFYLIEDCTYCASKAAQSIKTLTGLIGKCNIQLSHSVSQLELSLASPFGPDSVSSIGPIIKESSLIRESKLFYLFQYLLTKTQSITLNRTQHIELIIEKAHEFLHEAYFHANFNIENPFLDFLKCTCVLEFCLVVESALYLNSVNPMNAQLSSETKKKATEHRKIFHLQMQTLQARYLFRLARLWQSESMFKEITKVHPLAPQELNSLLSNLGRIWIPQLWKLCVFAFDFQTKKHLAGDDDMEEKTPFSFPEADKIALVRLLTPYNATLTIPGGAILVFTALWAVNTFQAPLADESRAALDTILNAR